MKKRSKQLTRNGKRLFTTTLMSGILALGLNGAVDAIPLCLPRLYVYDSTRLHCEALVAQMFEPLPQEILLD